jgi:hypothetical protein
MIVLNQDNDTATVDHIDSKSKRELAKMLIAYHGSQSSTAITTFDSGTDHQELSRDEENGTMSIGTYFSSDYDTALGYANGSFYTCQLDIANTLDLRTPEGAEIAEEFVNDAKNEYELSCDLFDEDGYIATQLQKGFGSFSVAFDQMGSDVRQVLNAIAEYAQSAGYDSIIFDDESREGQSISYIIFNTDQIEILEVTAT